MHKTLEQLNEQYGYKAEDFVNDGKAIQPPAFTKWLKAAWDIDSVYALAAADKISLSKARELVTSIIEAHIATIDWIAYDWNKPETRPQKYGKYFVHRKDGKIHLETWNGSGWAYNEKVITHWKKVKPPLK